MELIKNFHGWNIHYCKRSANSIADALSKFESPVVSNFRVTLPGQIQEIYLQEQKVAAEYTGTFYYNAGPGTDSSRTAFQI